MRYLSVCSGVEAASIAWHDLGWTPVGFSEIEPFPSAVLAHRFPSVKNYGDMTKYKEWDIEPGTVDVLVGGTPCQSFSVAGLRKGLDDPRGNLMLVYLGLAEHLRVPWLVWENVPGVLSSNGGRDFGTFLGALGELGYRWSFRVLDAQYFGVPQRRRRVFVVAHLGDGPHPASVLFESESLRGDTAKGGKKRQGAPRGAGKGAESGGRPFRMTAFGQYEDDDSGSTCKQRDYKDATDLVVQPAIEFNWANGGGYGNAHDGLGITIDGTGPLSVSQVPAVVQPACATGPVTHSLNCAHSATEDGTGRGTPIVPAIAFHPTQDPISSVEVMHALGTGSKSGCATAAVAMINMQGSKGNAVAVTHAPGTGGSKMGQASIAVIAPTLAAEPYTLAIRGRADGRELEYRQDGVANALLSGGGGRDGMGVGAVAFAQNTRDEVRLVGGDGQTVGALVAQPGMKQTTYLATEVTGTLSSRATAGGGLGTDFEVAGGLQPVGFDALQDCSLADTLALEDLSHADATQADARKVLRTVLDEIGAEAFVVWGLGVAASLQSPEVLQHYLHGESVRREAATQHCVGGVSLPLAEDGATWTLRGLREAGCARRSPCRWESHEQRHQELAAYLSGLSHSSASWRQIVQGVRQAVETLRILHDARSSIQEMGRSDDRQGQSVCISTEGHGVESDSFVRCLRLLEEASREWLLRDTRATSETRKAVMACRRLLPIETEALQGFPPDWTLIPWKGKPASECPDGPRYKAMGNSMAVPVMRWIGQRLDAVAKGDR